MGGTLPHGWRRHRCRSRCHLRRHRHQQHVRRALAATRDDVVDGMMNVMAMFWLAENCPGLMRTALMIDDGVSGAAGDGDDEVDGGDVDDDGVVGDGHNAGGREVVVDVGGRLHRERRRDGLGCSC